MHSDDICSRPRGGVVCDVVSPHLRTPLPPDTFSYHTNPVLTTSELLVNSTNHCTAVPAGYSSLVIITTVEYSNDDETCLYVQ